ncbi:hypothetical protein AVEN_84016-1 [Araneus ventricosus]|uniref:Retrotransposon gag domain-containing protein n=1 Tax=Araneus ventricosus TaxID=182803 RepID=A0A4Y2PW21_ARAVE|nr:hypothetical protein AVEN_84016-1 [Araneus ventricosus]
MHDSKETAPKLPDDTSSALVSVAPVPILTYQLPRNLCIFSGDDQQDTNKWLKDFQRIATYNHWNDQMCLANVIFYLVGTAQQWFDNNEDTFTNFTAFKNSLNNMFYRTDDQRRQAGRLLLTCTQQIGETSESYIQDVLSLCRKSRKSRCNAEKHNIETGNSAPIKQRPYRTSATERRVIEDEVQRMLKEDVIQPSDSPWPSPVVLVKKKNGE